MAILRGKTQPPTTAVSGVCGGRVSGRKCSAEDEADDDGFGDFSGQEEEVAVYAGRIGDSATGQGIDGEDVGKEKDVDEARRRTWTWTRQQGQGKEVDDARMWTRQGCGGGGEGV